MGQTFQSSPRFLLTYSVGAGSARLGGASADPRPRRRACLSLRAGRWQARRLTFTLVTADTAIRACDGVALLWAG